MRSLKKPVIAVLALAAALTASACQSGSHDDTAWEEARSSVQVAAQDAMGAPDSSADLGDWQEAEAPAQFQGAVVQEQLIRTADAQVTTREPAQAGDEFRGFVADLGGRVEYSSQEQVEAGASTSLTVKVPADRFDALLAKLPELGKVAWMSENSEDAGQTIADLDARRSVLETSIERLEKLVEDASTTEELLAAEEMMTQRQADLDSLNAVLDWYSDQVAMSTLTVTFSTEHVQVDGFSWQQAWYYLGQSFQFFGYALVVILPWAALTALLVLLARGFARRRKKRAQRARGAASKDE